MRARIPAKPASELDRIVFAKLASLDIQPVLCSDAVFVRRAYLDVIGTLPTAEEARSVHRGSGHEEQAHRLDRSSAGAG